jgi:hypothetical protein
MKPTEKDIKALTKIHRTAERIIGQDLAYIDELTDEVGFGTTFWKPQIFLRVKTLRNLKGIKAFNGSDLFLIFDVAY